MLRRISAVGLHCIALYQPLRGFYCDLHINERLSVCSRYHFSSGEGCSSLCSPEADLRDTRLKRTVLRATDWRVAYASGVFEFFLNSPVLLTSSVSEWEPLN